MSNAPFVEIEQVVASVVLNQSLNLDDISERINTPISKLDETPVLFHKLVVENEVTFLIFGSGKMVCSGAQSESEIKEAVIRLVLLLSSVGVEITETPSIEIQNVIALGRLGVVLDLEAVVKTLENCRLAHQPSSLGERLSYVTQNYQLEPFPWLIYGLRYPKVAIVLFGSGKFLITGAKSEEMNLKAATNFKDRLTELGII